MFSVSDAAFTGFRVVRAKPVILGWWTGLNLLFAVISAVVLVGLGGAALNDLRTLDQANPDLAAMGAIYGRLGPAYLILILISLVYYGIVYAAANRAVLQPDESRMGYLRFGGEEMKQALLIFVLGLVFFGAYMALGIGGAILMAIFSAIGGTFGAILGVTLLLAVVVAGLVFLGVKLSLSSAQTFATGKFNVFGSWALTKGKFWPLLGSYVIAAIMVVIVYVLILGVFAGVVFVSSGMPGLTSIFSPDTSSFGSFLNPTTIGYYVISALVGALALPLWLTPASWIYSQIAQPKTAEVFA